MADEKKVECEHTGHWINGGTLSVPRNNRLVVFVNQMCTNCGATQAKRMDLQIDLVDTVPNNSIIRN